MRQGGSYIIDKKTGKAKLVERTQDHPDGNLGPRDVSGKLLNVPEEAPAAEPSTSSSKTVKE